MSRISVSLLLLSIFLFIGGCSSSVKSTPQDKNITVIKTVLEHQFTGPDLELIGLLDNPADLEKYYEKLYQSYFTEEMYKKFITAYAFGYHIEAHNNDYQLKVESIEIEKVESTKGAYNFKVNELYKKDGTKQKTVVVSGRVNFNKDGKITSIRYLDDGGLSNALHE